MKIFMFYAKVKGKALLALTVASHSGEARELLVKHIIPDHDSEALFQVFEVLNPGLVDPVVLGWGYVNKEDYDD